MRKITKDPKLIKRRNEMILVLRQEGFFIDDIGLIFRLRQSRISQILKKLKKGNGQKKRV